MRRLRHVLGFLLVPAFSVVTPLVALPAVTARYGAEGWSSVAVGLATGAISSTIIELGWGWNGPARVARAARSAWPRLWASALTTRLLVASLMSPLAGIAAFAITPAHPLNAALTALGTSLIGLSPSWLFIGGGRPWALILLEMIPRAAGAITAAILLTIGSPLIAYAVAATIVPTFITQLLTLRDLRVGKGTLRGITFRRTVHSVRVQHAVMIARVASTVYMQLPIVLVSAIAPIATAAAYSGGDRLMRMTLTGLAPIPSISQRWVNSPDASSERWRRAKRAIWGNVLLGTLAGLAFTATAPLISSIIFSGVITITLSQSLWMGATIGIVCISRATGGLGLVVQSGHKALLRSAVIGAATGLLLLPPLTLQFGAAGASAAVFTSELLVLVTQLSFLNRRAKRK